MIPQTKNLTHYPEMIESELDRFMHEERILAQREQVEYRSSIARNVRYITKYPGKGGLAKLSL